MTTLIMQRNMNETAAGGHYYSVAGYIWMDYCADIFPKRSTAA
jgi:hypothetical protein